MYLYFSSKIIFRPGLEEARDKLETLALPEKVKRNKISQNEETGVKKNNTDEKKNSSVKESNKVKHKRKKSAVLARHI